jgi:hypothetical protein
MYSSSLLGVKMSRAARDRMGKNLERARARARAKVGAHLLIELEPELYIQSLFGLASLNEPTRHYDILSIKHIYEPSSNLLTSSISIYYEPNSSLSQALTFSLSSRINEPSPSLYNMPRAELELKI